MVTVAGEREIRDIVRHDRGHDAVKTAIRCHRDHRAVRGRGSVFRGSAESQGFS